MTDNISAIYPNLAWYQNQSVPLVMVAYNISPPIYCILAMVGHVVCLMAFRQQAKSEKAYYYQIFVVVSETIEIVFFFLYISCLFWMSGYKNRGGVGWFMANHDLMRYTAHVVTVQANMGITTTLLLTVAMAVDRVFALTKPFVYKNLNHRRHQLTALGICVALGVSTSGYDVGRFYARLRADTDIYEVVYDAAYVNGRLYGVCTQIRNFIRATALIILVSCNTVLTLAYRKRMKKVAVTLSSVAHKKDEQQRTLTLLSICQSFFNSISIASILIYYAVLVMIPSFSVCESFIWTPLLDFVLLIMRLADFYTVLAISKHFRRMVFSSVPCLERFVKPDTSPGKANTRQPKNVWQN